MAARPAWSSASQRLMRRTVAARERSASTIFMVGSVSASDRLISAAYFGAAARRWGRMSDRGSHLVAYLAGLEHCREPTFMLDLGTGTGDSAAAAAAHFPTARVVGVDTSRTMLRHARRRHAADNLQFRRASVLKLPWADGTVDLVTMLNAIAEPGELRRITRPGAQLMTASSIFPLRNERSAWVGRWHDAGFTRIACADTEPGSWEIYVAAGHTD